MVHLIDKSAVVAEIKRLISGLRRNCNPNPFGNMQECLAAAQIEAINLIKDFLDTLEVKEVDNTIIENLNELAINELKSLYSDIDKCITDLLTAKIKHDSESLEDIYWRMETLMINTQQVISYVLRHIEDS